MNLIKKIKQTGLNEQIPDWKASKIEAMNGMIFFSTLIITPFAFLFWESYPVLAIIVGAVVVLKLMHFGIVKAGYFDVARQLQTTLGAGGFVMLMHLFLRQPGEPLFLSLFFLQVVLSLSPLTLFDIREKKNLYVAMTLNILLLVVILLAEGQNVWGYENQSIRDGGLHYLMLTISMFYFITYLVQINKVSLKAVEYQEEIIEQMKQEQEKLEENSKQLNEYVEQVRVAHEEDEKRQWVSEGSNAIERILRSNREKDELQDKLIAEIVKYSGANQGGLFILNEENENDVHLRLEACFAYDRKKYIEKRVEIGQGMLGQCYLEAELTMLTEIPHNYVQITSGLGEAPPTCLILVPLIDNEKVQGVLEVASFKKFEPHQIEYFKEVAGSIASFIVTIKTTLLTHQLLEASNLQAGQLRSQEEEMRQNMEEMQATQEELARLRKEDEDRLQQVGQENERLQQKIKELESQLSMTN
jgi:GAF domain-containing protein